MSVEDRRRDAPRSSPCLFSLGREAAVLSVVFLDDLFPKKSPGSLRTIFLRYRDLLLKGKDEEV